MGIDEIVSLRLERGTSQVRGFTLDSACPRALFRIGTAIECNWQVQGPGIAPHHLMLLWKAGVLTLVDVGAGNVYVDGEAFTLSRTIRCGRIVFASAEICIRRLPKREMPACNDTADILLLTKKRS